MVIQHRLVFASKLLDIVYYYRQYYIAGNFVVSFRPVGCNDGPKGDVFTALYYINVKLTRTTQQSNAVWSKWVL